MSTDMNNNYGGGVDLSTPMVLDRSYMKGTLLRYSTDLYSHKRFLRETSIAVKKYSFTTECY